MIKQFKKKKKKLKCSRSAMYIAQMLATPLLKILFKAIFFAVNLWYACTRYPWVTKQGKLLQKQDKEKQTSTHRHTFPKTTWQC